MTTTTSTQRESDRAVYTEAQRAGMVLRAYARCYEALAEQVTADEELGRYSERAATVLRRGYVGLFMGLSDLAVEAEAEAAQYRELLVGEAS